MLEINRIRTNNLEITTTSNLELTKNLIFFVKNCL